jgi:hypothetical protein
MLPSASASVKVGRAKGKGKDAAAAAELIGSIAADWPLPFPPAS